MRSRGHVPGREPCPAEQDYAYYPSPLQSSIPVPPVEIENVDVRCAQLLQARSDAVLKRFGVVPHEIDLLLNLIIASVVIHRVLAAMSATTQRVKGEQTFVVMMSCSRISRCSAHSPMNLSESPSWLQEDQHTMKLIAKEKPTSYWQSR